MTKLRSILSELSCAGIKLPFPFIFKGGLLDYGGRGEILSIKSYLRMVISFKHALFVHAARVLVSERKHVVSNKQHTTGSFSDIPGTD